MTNKEIIKKAIERLDLENALEEAQAEQFRKDTDERVQSIKEAKQEEKVELSTYIIDQLSKSNPYPPDVFLPRSKEEMKAVSDLIAKAGYSPDGIFGQVSREAWNNAVEKLKELSENGLE